ncbi:hypothetical protein [Taibaiella chishuiensis]|nr:hypothetical protein [Taibaiella chishuiensis]
MRQVLRPVYKCRTDHIMDTRQLSPQTYKAILGEAGRFHPDLALRFGMLAKISESEADYIHKSAELIRFMQQYDDAAIDAVFLDNPLSPPAFRDALGHIANQLKTLEP